MYKFNALIVFLLAIIADQLSKWWVTEYLVKTVLEKPAPQSLGFFEWLVDAPARLPFISQEVLPFFNIVMVWNQGVSFGMFNNGDTMSIIFLTSVSLIISMIFAVWLWRSTSRLQSFAIALVISGALGNVFDRLRFGAVIDFLDVHFAEYHWPAFNVADSCICVGVFLLIVHSLFFDKAFETAGKDAT